MSSNILLKSKAKAAKKPAMASFLQDMLGKNSVSDNKKTFKNSYMSNLKTSSMPAPIFSWEYNMNELEFE